MDVTLPMLRIKGISWSVVIVSNQVPMGISVVSDLVAIYSVRSCYVNVIHGIRSPYTRRYLIYAVCGKTVIHNCIRVVGNKCVT